MRATLYTVPVFAFVLFTIASGCIKELSLENHLAKGTLKDTLGICLPQTVHGTFYNGIAPGADTAYIEVKVDVHTTGSYSVFTDLQNGFRFTSSGIFTTAGINIIKLIPEGIPNAQIPTDFIIRFDTSVCPLTINVHDSAEISQNNLPDTLPFYNWKFTDTKRGLTYRGVFENNYIFELGSINVLVLSTKNAQAPGDSSFIINIGLPTGAIEPGTFSTDDPPNGIVFKTYSDACINCAGGGLIPISIGATVIITIRGYDPVTKIIKGNFNGTTIDWFNEIAEISGEFITVVQ